MGTGCVVAQPVVREETGNQSATTGSDSARSAKGPVPVQAESSVYGDSFAKTPAPTPMDKFLVQYKPTLPSAAEIKALCSNFRSSGPVPPPRQAEPHGTWDMYAGPQGPLSIWTPSWSIGSIRMFNPGEGPVDFTNSVHIRILRRAEGVNRQYSSLEQTNPEMEGSIAVFAMVGRDGHVSLVSLRSHFKNCSPQAQRDLERTIRNIHESLTFEAIPRGGSYMYTHRFVPASHSLEIEVHRP